MIIYYSFLLSNPLGDRFVMTVLDCGSSCCSVVIIITNSKPSAIKDKNCI